MNNKLNELFDIHGAVSVWNIDHKYRSIEDKVKEILKAATAGREYIIKPEQLNARDLFDGLLTVKKNGDEIFIGDNSYCFAVMQGELAYDDGKDKERALFIAQAVNAAMSKPEVKPEVRDWLLGEEIPEVPFNCLANGVPVTVEERNELSGCLCRFMDGSIDVIHSRHLRPIQPKPKKIDHSSLVGSGIDCEYDRSGIGKYHKPYDETDACFKSIRMNHPMALTGEQVKAIPEGYNIQVFAQREWLSLDEFICDIECCDYYRIRIDRTKDGYEL